MKNSKEKIYHKEGSCGNRMVKEEDMERWCGRGGSGESLSFFILTLALPSALPEGKGSPSVCSESRQYISSFLPGGQRHAWRRELGSDIVPYTYTLSVFLSVILP